MSDDIRPGDVVVCIDESPCGCCGAYYPDLAIGRLFRVTGTKPLMNYRTGLNVTGLLWPDQPRVGDHPEMAGRNPARFRKLPTADTEFTAQMRAMKPRVRSNQEA